MSYPVFHERLQKLELARLVDLFAVRRKGRARVVLVLEGVEEVVAGGCPAAVAEGGREQYGREA